DTPTDSTSADLASTGDSLAPTDTPTDSGSPAASPDGPAGVVTAYFDAVERGDFQSAWELGGKNLGGDYGSFVAGFADTTSDNAQVGSVQGDQVSVDLQAVQSDGTTHDYSGTYTVQNGVITGAQMTQTG
ncbi:MAG: hypothetical protein ACRDVE_22305, partial [Actinocrinis sp.]